MDWEWKPYKMKDVKTLAREAMAQEKARIMWRKIKRPSALEQEAERWKQKKGLEERRLEEERRRIQREGEMSVISLQKVAVQSLTRDDKNDAVEWIQYSPWKKEDSKQKRSLNAASIWVFARSLMAREWARALGKKRQDPLKYALEREATLWREKKEEERRRLERTRERTQL